MSTPSFRNFIARPSRSGLRLLGMRLVRWRWWYIVSSVGAWLAHSTTWIARRTGIPRADPMRRSWDNGASSYDNSTIDSDVVVILYKVSRSAACAAHTSWKARITSIPRVDLMNTILNGTSSYDNSSPDSNIVIVLFSRSIADHAVWRAFWVLFLLDGPSAAISRLAISD